MSILTELKSENPSPQSEEEVSKTSCSCMNKLVNAYSFCLKLAHYLQPVVGLLVRVVVGYVFLSSGLTKIPAEYSFGLGTGNWDTTLFLFEEEYKVPLLSATFAAYAGTIVELIAPLMLFIGLGTRFGAAALLGTTAIIEYVYPGTKVHLYYAVMLAVVFIYGPGKLSIDHLIRRKLLREKQA